MVSQKRGENTILIDGDEGLGFSYTGHLRWSDDYIIANIPCAVMWSPRGREANKPTQWQASVHASHESTSEMGSCTAGLGLRRVSHLVWCHVSDRCQCYQCL